MKKFWTTIMLSFAAILAYSVVPFPFELVNNSQFNDDEIYIGMVAKRSVDGRVEDVYFDFKTNSVKKMSSSVNTIHKTNGDWGYADMFTKLSEISNRKFDMPFIFAGRIFVSFKSPMYIHFHEGGDEAGYAGANLEAGENDPNYGIRWELAEFSVATNGVWLNTSRVDAFQYPMAVELWGKVFDAGANGMVDNYAKAGELLNYSQIIERWRNQLGNDNDFKHCMVSSINKDNLGPIILQASKVQAFKEGQSSANYYQSYIDQIWSTYKGRELRCNQGERGVWYGRIDNNDVLTMTGTLGAFNGVQAKVYGKPNTQEVIEGKGKMAQGGQQDAALQAQICGALARGVIKLETPDGVEQDWGDASYYFKHNTYNKYVAFFHQTDISYNGKTYAFAYDDTFDQSSTIYTTEPTKARLSIGGWTSNPGDHAGDGTGGEQGGGEQGGGTNPPTGDATGSGSTDGLNYAYAFTYANGKLKVTFTCTNSGSYTGLVPVLFSYSASPFETIGAAGNTVSAEFAANPGDTMEFASKWMYAGGATVTGKVSYTIPNGGGSTTPDPEPEPEPSNECYLIPSVQQEKAYFNPDWAGESNDYVYTLNGSNAYIKLNKATTAQWQAQFWMKAPSTLALNDGTSYKFSMDIHSTKAIEKVTAKLVQRGNDGLFLFSKEFNLSANSTQHFTYTGSAPGGMTDCLLVLDFGGVSPAGNEIYVDNIALNNANCVPTEMEEVVAKSVTVYPNPTADYLYVDGVESEEYVVTDLTGAERASGSQLPALVSNLAKGMYIISIDGNSMKFMKK